MHRISLVGAMAYPSSSASAQSMTASLPSAKGKRRVAINVLIPWKMPIYVHLNGYHPLIASVVESRPRGLDFIFCDTYRDPDEHIREVVSNEFQSSIMKIGGMANRSEAVAFIEEFNTRYDPFMQHTIQSFLGTADVVFHHTAPIHMSTLPFVLHFESITTLFYPFLHEGDTANIKIRELPIYKVIRGKLESPLCRAIFSHMKAGVDALIRCFDSQIIASKTRFVPLGVGIPTKYSLMVKRKLAQPIRKNGLNILFTNSNHRGGQNFFHRGGLELLYAFYRLRSKVPEAHLTIVSPRLPEADWLVEALGDGLTWIADRIDDETLFDWLLWSDVFARPAAGLHSYSALRALKFGSVLICSDAPGYSEFVEHDQTAIVVGGRRETIYRYDANTGLMHTDFGSIVYPDVNIANDLAENFHRLSESPEMRHRIATAAYHRVTIAHAPDIWARSVAGILKAAANDPS
jgi:glycosyltransferase involved in cell wall biosynthesis